MYADTEHKDERGKGRLKKKITKTKEMKPLVILCHF